MALCDFCKENDADQRSATGHASCSTCRNETTVYWADAADDPIPPDQLPATVNLRELLDGEPPEQEWLVEPLIVARRHTGIVARRGEGKSLIALNIALAKAAGDGLLDQKAGDPIHVVYIDQEMGPEDLYERMSDFGYTTDHPKFDVLEEHLHYFQLIDIAPLNTVEGGKTLEQIVDAHSAQLVIIDTLSRVVKGDENATEPYQELWDHTEKRLKRRGVTYVRLDHLGKDIKKGSRGASAKEDPLDIVFNLRISTAGRLFFDKTKGRQPWLPEAVAVDRVMENGVLSHRTETQFAPQWLLDLVDEIEALGLGVDASQNSVQKALQATGRGRRRGDIAKAVRFIKGRAQQSGNHPGTTLREPTREPSGTTTQETLPEQGEHDGNHPGNRPELVVVPTTNPIGGNHPDGNLPFDDETDLIAP